MSAVAVSSCSWLPMDEGPPVWLHTVVNDEMGSGFVVAEDLMRDSVANKEGAAGPVALEDGGPAPWVQLRCPASAALALCLSTNARVVEVHQTDGSAADTASVPLLTMEGTEAADGVYLHFMMNDGVAPLLPAGVPYRLKLFGRHPRTAVQVRCLCLVLSPLPEDVGEGSDARAWQKPTPESEPQAPPHSPVPAKGSEEEPRAERAILLGIQSALLHMNAQMGAMTATVAALESRLSAVEGRLAHSGAAGGEGARERPFPERDGADTAEEAGEP